MDMSFIDFLGGSCRRGFFDGAGDGDGSCHPRLLGQLLSVAIVGSFSVSSPEVKPVLTGGRGK